jgi:hypothetical protein
MNAPQFGLKFFLFGGAILIVSGVAQVLTRPRGKRDQGLQRYLNASVIRAVVFVTAGGLAIMVGLGIIPIGGR